MRESERKTFVIDSISLRWRLRLIDQPVLSYDGMLAFVTHEAAPMDLLWIKRRLE